MQAVVGGCGPAALSLATALSRNGIKTTVMAPAPLAAWPANYGIWRDQAEALGLFSAVDSSWDKTTFFAPGGERLDLNRPYVRLHTPALQSHLLDEARKAGVAFLEDRIDAAHLRGDEWVIHHGNRRTRCVLFVDATGAARPLGAEQEPSVSAYQSALGVEIESAAAPWPEDAMTFMDWRPLLCHPEQPPSFAYVMPLGGGRFFVEETVLIAAPAVPFSVLRDRLAERVAPLGVAPTDWHERERCLIPMDRAPTPKQARTVRFGAAAGMIHPATGYSLAHSLFTALRLGPLIGQALQMGIAGQRLVELANHAVWPRAQRQAHALYGWGARSMQALPKARLGHFFHRFLGLPSGLWINYLDRTHSPFGIITTMWRVFGALPLPERAGLSLSSLRALKRRSELSRTP
jgi:lycopene beta-cyclase